MLRYALALALALPFRAQAGPDLSKDTYAAMSEEDKEKIASKQDFAWSLNGIAKPSKILTGPFAVKKIGILSSMLNASVQQKSYKFSDSYSETTVWSMQSYSPAMMLAISNKFHDQTVEALKKHGFEVAPATEIAKAPGIGELVNEFKDKNPSDQVSWYVPSEGSTKIGPLAAASMSGRKEWMAKLIKDTQQQMLLHSINSMMLAQGKKAEVEEVKGMNINVSMQMFGTYTTSGEFFIEAAKAAGLYNGFWKNIGNGGFVVNYSKLLKVTVFIPSEEIADKEKAARMQNQYLTAPLLETQALLADLNARGLLQQLAK